MTDNEYPKERLAEDYKAMIEADRGHLAVALEHGDRVIAHRYVNSIIDNQRLLADLAL